MSSRGMISGRQRTNSYRPDGMIAQSILDATIVDARVAQPVIRCIAENTFVKGQAAIAAGSHFYLVSSTKFIGRYYVVVAHRGEWFCSSKDAEITAQCIEKAQRYRQALLARQTTLAA